MAANTLPVLSHPQVPQAFDHLVEELTKVIRAAEIATAETLLTTCYWSDEHCDCRSLATVHHIASELEFCERHFAAVEKGAVIL